MRGVPGVPGLSPTGHKQSVEHYTAGIRNGPSRVWDDGGQLRLEAFYLGGELHRWKRVLPVSAEDVWRLITGGSKALHGTYLGDGITTGDFGTGVPGAALLFVADFGFAYSGSPL